MDTTIQKYLDNYRDNERAQVNATIRKLSGTIGDAFKTDAELVKEELEKIQARRAAQMPTAHTTAAPGIRMPKGDVVVKQVLIERLKPIWPTIESDLRAGNTELIKAARASHGRYYVDAARSWAERNGKIKKSTMANLSGKTYRWP